VEDVMTNERMIVISVVALGLSFACGCGGGALQNAHEPRWERRELARGVELLIRDDASVEAQRVAEDFQRELRSRDLSARQ
jgi:hypothetical protein